MTHTVPLDATGAGPLVCGEALQALVDQLGIPAAAAFVERFVRLWPMRRHRLHLAVKHRDVKASQDAALSLASSASMAGAHRLAELGSRLHAGVSAPGSTTAWAKVAGLMDELDRLGEDSVAEVAQLANDICLTCGPAAG